MRSPSPIPTPMTCGSATSCTGRACSSPAGATPARPISTRCSTMPLAWCPSPPSIWHGKRRLLLQDALKQALLRRGLPRRLYVDYADAWVAPTSTGSVLVEATRRGPRRYRETIQAPILILPSTLSEQEEVWAEQSPRQGRSGVAGPLAPFAAEFKSGLRDVGYTQLTTANGLRVMAHLNSRWLEAGGMTVADLDQRAGRAVPRCPTLCWL